MAKEILIIENEGFIAGLLSKSLAQKGYDIAILERKEDFNRARRHKVSLLLLEAPSSAIETAETCRFLRDVTTAPIIVLTEFPAGLEAIDGVDYLTKPLAFRELLMAVENALTRQRRTRKRTPRVLHCGDLTLDLQTHWLTKGEHRYHLTPKEFLLLKLFMSNPGQVLNHKTIMKEVWNTDYLDARGTLQVHVSWLRRKIEDTPPKPVCLRTVRGVGYRFEVKP